MFAGKYALRLLISVMVMAALLVYATPSVQAWLAADVWWRVSHILGLVTAGLGAFVVLLAALGTRLQEIRDPGYH